MSQVPVVMRRLTESILISSSWIGSRIVLVTDSLVCSDSFFHALDFHGNQQPVGCVESEASQKQEDFSTFC